MVEGLKLGYLRDFDSFEGGQVLVSVCRTFKNIIEVYEKIMHARLVEDIGDSENKYFLNCHLFGTSKLGDNFYINLALFSGEEINLSITIRSRDKAVKDIIYKELLHSKFTEI